MIPSAPWVVVETEGFLVVHKPPLIHSAPLKDGGDTLLDWCANLYPEVRIPRGRRGQGREGGLLHRLDYGTWGLVLIARTQAVLDALEEQQEQGTLIKEYGALTASVPRPLLPGFPSVESPEIVSRALPFTIESGFRPFGTGRRAVRPFLMRDGAKKPRREFALDKGNPYRTGIRELNSTGKTCYFRLRIVRGFRHQIRCHLAWLGYPVLGDGLYGAGDSCGVNVPLGLKAQGLFFRDPLSGEDRQYRLPPIHIEKKSFLDYHLPYEL